MIIGWYIFLVCPCENVCMYVSAAFSVILLLWSSMDFRRHVVTVGRA